MMIFLPAKPSICLPHAPSESAVQASTMTTLEYPFKDSSCGIAKPKCPRTALDCAFIPPGERSSGRGTILLMAIALATASRSARDWKVTRVLPEREETSLEVFSIFLSMKNLTRACDKKRDGCKQVQDTGVSLATASRFFSPTVRSARYASRIIRAKQRPS